MGSRGLHEVNYSVSVNTDVGTIGFIKESIWENRNPYKVFIELFPVLKIFKKKDIIIHKCWESFHPFSTRGYYKNKYDRIRAENYTKMFYRNYNEIKDKTNNYE